MASTSRSGAGRQIEIEVPEMELAQGAVGKLEREEVAVISKVLANLAGSDQANLFREEG
jgi:hypothetical protein